MRLLNDLKKEHGKPVVKQHIASFTTFTWLLDDRTIQFQFEMIPDQDNDSNKIGYFLNPNGGFLKSDSYEPNHVWKVYVYIFANDYPEELKEKISFNNSFSGLKPYFNDYTKDTISPY